MNGTRTCNMNGCNAVYEARGMCKPHYSHWKYVTPVSERYRPTVTERFEAKFVRGGPTECWPWTAGATSDGYGRFKTTGTAKVIASRFALILHSGDPSEPSMVACHTCDNPPCVNPAHLYWGTQTDNSQDAVARGRKAKGEGHPRAKLTESDVVTIRAAVAAGSRIVDIAAEYGVSGPTVSAAISGRSWSHIPMQGK